MKMLSEVSRRYARALFELVAGSKTEEILKQLRKVQQSLDNPKIQELVTSPVLSRKEKVLIAEQILSNHEVSDEVENLVRLAASKDRLSKFAEIVKAFELISDEKNKVLRGVVTSPEELTRAEKEEIEEVISKFTGYQLLLDFIEDESLIGGVHAQVGSFTFDGTLNTQLTRLKEDINRRVN